MLLRLRRAFALLSCLALAGFAALPACSEDESATPIDCGAKGREVPKDGSIAFGEGCCGDDECANGACADFQQEGTLCSKLCTSDADCAGLGPEHCGGKGTCKTRND